MHGSLLQLVGCGRLVTGSSSGVCLDSFFLLNYAEFMRHGDPQVVDLVDKSLVCLHFVNQELHQLLVFVELLVDRVDVLL